MRTFEWYMARRLKQEMERRELEELRHLARLRSQSTDTTPTGGYGPGGPVVQIRISNSYDFTPASFYVTSPTYTLRIGY